MSDTPLPDVRTQALLLLSTMHARVIPPSLSACLTELASTTPIECTQSQIDEWLDVIDRQTTSDADLRHYVLERASVQSLLLAQLAFAELFDVLQTSPESSPEFQLIARCALTRPAFRVVLRMGIDSMSGA